MCLVLAVSKAYKILEDEEQLQYCKEIVEEAKIVVEMKVGLSLSLTHTHTHTHEFSSPLLVEGDEKGCQEARKGTQRRQGS